MFIKSTDMLWSVPPAGSCTMRRVLCFAPAWKMPEYIIEKIEGLCHFVILVVSSFAPKYSLRPLKIQLAMSPYLPLVAGASMIIYRMFTLSLTRSCGRHPWGRELRAPNEPACLYEIREIKIPETCTNSSRRRSLAVLWYCPGSLARRKI